MLFKTCEFSQVPSLSIGVQGTLISLLLINIVGQVHTADTTDGKVTTRDPESPSFIPAQARPRGIHNILLFLNFT